jgi:spore coat polysaccharide biosynthesis protein SpsF
MMVCSDVLTSTSVKAPIPANDLLHQPQLLKQKDPPFERKILIIVQARMGSTRLPGKIMKKVLGRPLLDFLIQRLKRVSLADGIVIATTKNPADGKIVNFCLGQEIFCFTGSEHDVLDRYYQAATKFKADIIVRVTSDCPLIDPLLIDKLISFYLELQPNCDYLSNTIVRSFPRGMDVEVFSYRSLELAAEQAVLPEEREHVTPFIYRHPELFKIHSYIHPEDNSKYRWTVDCPEDLVLITKILENIYPERPEFTLQDLLSLLEEHPDWSKINAHIDQKRL